MKELHNYKEEIFRRSEVKKRQIRKRRRIALGVGIPLCLCAVLTAVMLPGLPLSMKGDAAPNMEAVYDESGKLELPLTDVEDSVTGDCFTARVLECGEGWVLVEPLEGEPERNSCDRISFATGDLEDIGVTVGAEVEITYDGQIMETYPAQIRPTGWRKK